MYTIVALDGREYGPVDFHTLQLWASQGRVNPQTLVRNQDTGEQSMVDQLQFLQPIFSAPPVQVSSNSPPTYIPYPVSPYLRPGVIQVTPGSHSPVLAVLLSLFCIIGIGQMYNRQVGKGLVILGVSVVLALLTLGFSIIVTYPLAAIDAGIVAGRLNRGEAITDWQWF